MDALLTYFRPSTDMSVWLVQVFVVVFCTVSLNFVLMRVLDAVLRWTEKTRSQWDDALIGAARIPLRLFVWVWGLSVAAHILHGG